MRFTSKQVDEFAAQTRMDQYLVMIEDHTREIKEVHAPLAAAIMARPDRDLMSHFERIHALTRDREYQRALLAIWGAGDVDIFTHPEFQYILNHKLLTGDAKARHIVMSFQIASRGGS